MNDVLLVWAVMTLVAPGSSERPRPSTSASAGEIEVAEYGIEAAGADVHAILHGRGRVYLEARARLEGHPELAATAVVDRLAGVPAPGPQQRDRLLAVLAALHLPEQVQVFADRLRDALLDGHTVEPWLGLLLDQGAAAVDPLFALVGDARLPLEDRGALLDALIDILPQSRLHELSPEVGVGAPILQVHLRRGLVRRASADPDDRRTIVASLLATMRAVDHDGPRLAAIIVLIDSCGADEETYRGSLEEIAANDARPFVARAAAIHALGGVAAAGPSLSAIARRHARPTTGHRQQSELLTWLALTALDRGVAKTIAEELNLRQSESPRLASLAYGLVDLPADDDWLAEARRHAWPEVHRAAIDRVEGPCSRQTVRRLAHAAAPTDSGSAADPRVGRAAVQALGRCGDDKALDAIAAVLGDRELAGPVRSSAAKELVARDVPGGADLVARLLARDQFPELSRELAESLAEAPAPSTLVREALCVARDGGDPRVVPAARATLDRLYPDDSCADLAGDTSAASPLQPHE